MTTFTVGSLVRARGREWVVLPESRPDEDLWILRPLGGTDDEVTGIYRPLEAIEPAEFALPDPTRDLGSHVSCRLLREAVRLGFRSGAGPFRSLARIAVDPRPYQLVPLLMALRLDPVRLLIADDVGCGKTVEASLIARELMDRGEIERLAVLCPPHLAEQWQRALKEQFHIEAALVLPGTAARLERACAAGESLFERHPHTVISLDFIKSERRRHEFLRTCPELVIVDEAHGCAAASLGRAAQQRHDLLRQVAAKADRHLILVTATPHSGKEDDFRSLLSLLDPGFKELPQDLGGEQNRKHREALARHFVQRRRGDLEAFLDVQTPFPKREISERTYDLHKDYKAFLGRVLAWCREQVKAAEGEELRRRRVRWWSALALLRSLASSPEAAAATLRNRAASASAETAEEADAVGERMVLDQEGEAVEGSDVIPGSQTDALPADGKAVDSPDRKRLLEFANEVEKLAGTKDKKLQKVLEIVQELLKDGFAPIVFCRFIPTVDYVAAALRKKLGKNVQVLSVTGQSAPEEREATIAEVDEQQPRVLVCTDCLSEGINLQHVFDAVVHYDLCWNPTRHEQREGRVDRYGQRSQTVRTLTFYGTDNPVDGIVLDVLLRKHKSIHGQLGITVPVPMNTNAVVQAIFEGLMLRGKPSETQQTLFDFVLPQKQEVEAAWEEAVERHKRSRTIFAQRSIDLAEIRTELDATRRAIGDEASIERFVRDALPALGATLTDGRSKDGKPVPVTVDPTGAPAAVRDAIGREKSFKVAFEPRAHLRGSELLGRTHPVVAGAAAHIFEAALDPALGGPARRCGAIRTRDVTKRTTLLLLRLRFHLVTPRPDGTERKLLAEDQLVLGFRGAPDRAEWLEPDAVEPLLRAEPQANLPPDLARERFLEPVLATFRERPSAFMSPIEDAVQQRGKDLLEAHRRVRKAARHGVRNLRVEPHLPADVLGVFVLLPVADGGAA
ncbi:MAG: DEAD/DEAH box helicase [Planctomycetes bacterium]|nr:DEAD/DEAH box helicase [Planctomycetota bacterium]